MPLSQPNRNKNNINSARPIRSSRTSCRLHVFLWVLIGAMHCLAPLWLARVITLVLGSRNSIENCSTAIKYYSLYILSHYILSHYILQLDFWKAPHKVGLAVDIHVADDMYKILAVMLKEQNIQFQILIFDVEKLVDDENRMQARGLRSSYDSRYHPLNEVMKAVRNLMALVSESHFWW